MGRRFDKERDNLTAFPHSEEHIFAMFPEDIKIMPGKTVAEIDVPTLCVDEKKLAQDIYLRLSGRRKSALSALTEAEKLR